MELTKVHYEITNGVAYITLDYQPNLNVLDEPMQRQIMWCLDACQYDPQVKVVVLQAEGRAFSGGGDIKGMIAELEKPDIRDTIMPEALTWPGLIAHKIRGMKKPVVAAIQGAVAGAAANLVLMCDFRIAAEDAMFIEAFVKIGLITDGGGVYILNKLVGPAKTTELVMTGRPVDSKEAKELGLVTEVVPNDELRAKTIKFAEKLARGPGLSYQYLKTLINQVAFPDLDTVLAAEAEYQLTCAQTKDCLEGMKAFVEKRRPEFKGR